MEWYESTAWPLAVFLWALSLVVFLLVRRNALEYASRRAGMSRRNLETRVALVSFALAACAVLGVLILANGVRDARTSLDDLLGWNDATVPIIVLGLIVCAGICGAHGALRWEERSFE